MSIEVQERAVDLPNITLQQFKTQMILSLGALYDLIFNSSDTVQLAWDKIEYLITVLLAPKSDKGNKD